MSTSNFIQLWNIPPIVPDKHQISIGAHPSVKFHFINVFINIKVYFPSRLKKHCLEYALSSLWSLQRSSLSHPFTLLKTPRSLFFGQNGRFFITMSMEHFVPASCFKLLLCFSRKSDNCIPTDRSIRHVPPNIVYYTKVSSCCVSPPTHELFLSTSSNMVNNITNKFLRDLGPSIVP